MSFGPCIPFSALKELRRGIHEPGDVYKMALYSPSAMLSAVTTTYSASDEVSSPGYSAGGAVIPGFVMERSNTMIHFLWPDMAWRAVTITANGGMIYNASKGNRALAIFAFEKPISSVNGQFCVLEWEYFVETAYSLESLATAANTPSINPVRRALNFLMPKN